MVNATGEVKPLKIKQVKMVKGKHSPETKLAVVECVGETGSIKQAAKMVGVHVNTIRNWQAEDTDFRNAIAEAHTGIKDIANDTLLCVLTDPESTNRDKIQACKVLRDINIPKRSEHVNVNISGGMHELKEALLKRPDFEVLENDG